MHDGRVYNALELAVLAGHIGVVRMLRRLGWRPHALLSSDAADGITRLDQAAKQGNAQLVAALLEVLKLEWLDLGYDRMETAKVDAFVSAASNGHLSIAKILPKHGADPFSASSTFEDLVFQPPNSTEFQMSPTPLYAASANGQTTMVEFLLANGADPDGRSPTGVPSTKQQVANGEQSKFTRRRIFYSDKRAYEIRDIIAKINVAHWQRPLTGAAVNGQLEVVKTLLRTKVDISAKDPNGDTALFLAASLGYSEVVRALLEAGATPKEVIENGRAGWQLFLCAADLKRVAGVKCLLELGVHPVRMTEDRQSPLHLAATTGSPIAVKLLLEAGATTECRDSKRNTPLVAACLSGNVEAALVLIDAGANINAENTRRQSLLAQSCRRASPEIVELLIASGAVINSADARGCTPLFASCERGDQRIVDLLLENSAEVDCRLSDTETYGTLDRIELEL